MVRRSVKSLGRMSHLCRCFSETIALYALRKYRHLKRMYPEYSVQDPLTDPHLPADKTPLPKKNT